MIKLATNLRNHGVNAILDQWDLRLGSDLRFFMENGLSDAALVLCICSQNYVQKVNTGIGGSGYEGMIMTQSLLHNAKTEFVITAVRNNSSNNKVPIAFGSKLYIDFSNDDQYSAKYQELLERIYGVDSKRKPPLGSNPFSTEFIRIIDTKTKLESVQYHSPTMNGTVIFRFDNNNGNYTLGNGEYEFNTRWSRSGNNSIHAYGKLGYKNGENNFPRFEELQTYDFSSDSRTIRTGQIVVIQNIFGKFLAIKMGDVKSSGHGYEIDEMTFEYKIYDLL